MHLKILDYSAKCLWFRQNEWIWRGACQAQLMVFNATFNMFKLELSNNGQFFNFLFRNSDHLLCDFLLPDKGVGLWCFTPLSIIFQLYPGSQFLFGGGSESPQRQTCHKSLTNFYHIMLCRLHRTHVTDDQHWWHR